MGIALVSDRAMQSRSAPETRQGIPSRPPQAKRVQNVRIYGLRILWHKDCDMQ